MAYKNTIQEGLRSKILFKCEELLFLFFSITQNFLPKKKKNRILVKTAPAFVLI